MKTNMNVITTKISEFENSSNLTNIEFINYEPFYKLLIRICKGDEINILFLGGSITAGHTSYPSSSDYIADRDSWRGRTFDYLKRNYEKYDGQFKQINSSISGTGSLLGCIRLSEDVIKHRPDLIFIEFAVNDNCFADISVQEPYCEYSIFSTLNRIERRLKVLNPDIAIIMPISTYRLNVDSSLSGWQYNMKKSAEITEQFCVISKLPYVDIYKEYYKSNLTVFQKNKLFLDSSFIGNIVHPAPFGHYIYAEAVCKVLKQCFEFNYKTNSNFNANAFVEKIKIPVSPKDTMLIFPEELLTYTKNAEIEKMNNSPLDQILNNRKHLSLNNTNSKLEFSFRGTMIGAWFGENCACRMKIFLDDDYVGIWSKNTSDEKDSLANLDYPVFSWKLDKDIIHKLVIEPCEDQKSEDSKAFNCNINALFVEGYNAVNVY
jgi:hypothetical protein